VFGIGRREMSDIYPDRRDEIWPGISKGKADFLQKKWKREPGGGSLRYKGFVFALSPESNGESWSGEVRGRKEHKRLLPDRPMSVLEAKATLYDKMWTIKKRREIESKIAKKTAK
jgi:hypothetical protein